MICEKCGKEHDGSYGSGRFCGLSCSNSRTWSEEHKEKLREKLKKSTKERKKCLVCGKKLGLNNKSGFCFEHLYGTPKEGSRRIKRFCKKCGKEIYRGSKSNFCIKCFPESPLSNKYKNLKKWILGELTGRPRKSIKDYILKEQNNKCAICGMTPEWNGKKIVFICDHINGDSSDNRKGNLRLICPNCDSQTPTFKSKNKNKGRKYDREYRLNYYHKNKKLGS